MQHSNINVIGHKSIYPRRSSMAIFIVSRPLSMVLIYCIAFALAAPFSSKGLSEYVYEYESQVLMESSNFIFKTKAHLEILKETHTNTLKNSSNHGDESSSNWLVSLSLKDPSFYESSSAGLGNSIESKVEISGKHLSLFNKDHRIYAKIQSYRNGIARIKEIYSHQLDVNMFKNIKKSILLYLMTSEHNLGKFTLKASNETTSNTNRSFEDDNNLAQPDLFSPQTNSRVYIEAKPIKFKGHPQMASSTNNDPKKKLNIQPLILSESVEGNQNVSFSSRVFSEARSNLSTSFKLQLVDMNESKSGEKFKELDSIDAAIKELLADSNQRYKPDSIELQREAQVCSNHHCKRSLIELSQQDYRGSLKEDAIASVGGSLAFIRLLDRIREFRESHSSDILAILKKLKADMAAQASFLDILAAARTKESISSALKYLRLHENDNTGPAERFLAVLAISAKTSAKAHLKRFLMSPFTREMGPPLKRSQKAREQISRMISIEMIGDELISILEKTTPNKWRSHKLRWSTILTLATLVNAHHQENNYTNVEDEFSSRVTNLLSKELNYCQDSSWSTDCRVVMLLAMGNVGYLDEAQFQAIQVQILGDGRRESIAAIRTLKDLLSHRAKSNPFSDKFYKSLNDLMLRVVYDNTKETTARVIASEIIARFLPNNLNVSEQLIRHLPAFRNRELATMIYSRTSSLTREQDPRIESIGENWYWKSCITNGTSASFVRTLAKTEGLNASYAVNVELLDRKKLLKVSNFDVFLDTKERTQDLFSLEIFTRGLSNIPLVGGSEGGADHHNAHYQDSAEEKNESLMAGMSLKLLGGYLRPYVFFSSYYELGMHIFWGTAKNPMSAFTGNMLLIDHDEGFPLISGFVAEHRMRGVLSIDVNGKADASLMSGSHAIVRTKAAFVVQASQSIFTSYENLWMSNLFSFGGEALIGFVSDASWSSKPYEMCLQVTQPEFLFR